MNNTLHYEPRGQRQRFEPQVQQHREREQRGRHIHLHLNVHVHFNLGERRARVRRFLQPTVARVTAIFAAFIGALSMALSFFIMSNAFFHFIGPYIDLANIIMLVGALLGSGAVLLGGLPLVISAWRSTPRSRLLLSVPLLLILGLLAFTPLFRVINVPLLLAELLLLAALWRPTWRKRSLFMLLALVILTIPLASLVVTAIQLLYNLLESWSNGYTAVVLFAFLFYAIPLVSTIAIVRAIRQAKLSDRLLRFTTLPSLLVGGGTFFMIAGLLVWAGTVLFFFPDLFPRILGVLAIPYTSWLLQFIIMLIALVVILWALFLRSHARTEALPKDPSPSHPGSFHEHDSPLGNPNREQE
jgi:MFS family permease